MPEILNETALSWRDGAAVTTDVALSWQDGTSVYAEMSAYTPPPAPPGGVPAVPAPLTAFKTIAPQAVYSVAHTMSALDLRDNAPLPLSSVSITLDADSTLWALRAAAPDEVFNKLTTGEQPAQIRVTINGEQWAFVVDSVSRQRAFGQQGVSIAGRSLAALAGAPYQFEQVWTIDGDTTAAQISAIANQFTGLDVLFELDDWLIPDRVFNYSGTPLGVVRRVAEAVGAVVEANKASMGVRVRRRYTALPHEWPFEAPDLQVAWDAVRTESYERADQPEYDGVYLSGQQSGVVGYVKLNGTAGGNLHPLVTELLLTDEIAVRQRGEAILGASGQQARVTLTLPMLPGIGAVGLGDIVKVMDPARAWWGMVRGVSIDARLGAASQTVTLERHTKPIAGSTSLTSSMVLGSDIPDFTFPAGDIVSEDISGYWTAPEGTLSITRASGALPPGLTVSLAGVISGTPIAVGTYEGLVFRGTDEGGGVVNSNEVTFTITPAGAFTFVGPVPTLDGEVGVAFAEPLGSYWVGGVPDYTFAVFSGTLPAGLSLNPASGEISGTPTAVSTASVVIRATDQQGLTANSSSISFNITGYAIDPLPSGDWLYYDSFQGAPGFINGVNALFPVTPYAASIYTPSWGDLYRVDGQLIGDQTLPGTQTLRARSLAVENGPLENFTLEMLVTGLVNNNNTTAQEIGLFLFASDNTEPFLTFSLQKGTNLSRVFTVSDTTVFRNDIIADNDDAPTFPPYSVKSGQFLLSLSCVNDVATLAVAGTTLATFPMTDVNRRPITRIELRWTGGYQYSYKLDRASILQLGTPTPLATYIYNDTFDGAAGFIRGTAPSVPSSVNYAASVSDPSHLDLYRDGSGALLGDQVFHNALRERSNNLNIPDVSIGNYRIEFQMTGIASASENFQAWALRIHSSTRFIEFMVAKDVTQTYYQVTEPIDETLNEAGQIAEEGITGASTIIGDFTIALQVVGGVGQIYLNGSTFGTTFSASTATGFTATRMELRYVGGYENFYKLRRAFIQVL